MKILVICIILFPFGLYSQDSDFNNDDCWKEYKHENLPYPESEHCPFILCPDSSSVCYLKEDNEIYTAVDGWYKINDTQLQLGEDGAIFNVLKQTELEMHIQSVEHPEFNIYLKK